MQAGCATFWQPQSPVAKYSVRKGREADGFVGQIFTIAAAPIMHIVTWLAKTPINAVPPVKDERTGGAWTIPLEAPPLVPFMPQALSFGTSTLDFDQGYDAPGTYRNPLATRQKEDAYEAVTQAQGDSRTDAARGDESSEAALKYENHAYLRMEARRAGLADKDKKVSQEDNPEQATAAYTAWRTRKIKTYLAENIDTNATDHSTIMTNPMHAQKALAYDVAIGACDIYEVDMKQLRIDADWRFLEGIEAGPRKRFFEYFNKGKFEAQSIYDWAQSSDEAIMQKKIKVHRQWGAKPRVREQ